MGIRLQCLARVLVPEERRDGAWRTPGRDERRRGVMTEVVARCLEADPLRCRTERSVPRRTVDDDDRALFYPASVNGAR